MVFTGFRDDDFYIKTNKRQYIGANDDLNNYVTIGNYACAANATAKTLSNCPTTYAFTLVVYNACDSSHLNSRDFADNTWMSFTQELTIYRDPFTKYYRQVTHNTDDSLVFNSWYKIDATKVT